MPTTANSTDIKGIKAEIKSIFDSNNTTTASPVDLSHAMSSGGAQIRVKQVFRLNLDRLPLQPTRLPAVTIYTDEKIPDRSRSTFAGTNQLRGKRSAELELKIAGIVTENTIPDKTQDLADDNIEQLMENVELILRANANLNGAVSYQFPERIRYFTGPDEETFYRLGIMDLICRVDY